MDAPFVYHRGVPSMGEMTGSDGCGDQRGVPSA